MKQKILGELNNPLLPDLKFLFSNEALDFAPELLEELLDEEKKDFEKNLKIKDEDINFETFNDFSLLDYYFGLLYHFYSVKSNDKIRKIIDDFEEKYTDFGNYVSYSKRYYEMLCYCRKKCINLEEDQKRILDLTIKSFEIRGIALEENKQNELKKINVELSKLTQNFGKNVLDSEKEFEYLFQDDTTLKELPIEDLKIAKNRAEEKGKKGYLFDSSSSCFSSIMKYCSDGKIRKYFSDSRNSFASSGVFDNRELVLKIISLRNRKASILGYKSYSDLALVFRMAKSPKQVIDLLEKITTRAKTKAKKEIDDLKTYFKLKEIDYYDSAYYFRKLRKERYDLDDNELKAYFEFNNILNSLFEISKNLFGVSMKKIEISLYYDDIKTYGIYKDNNLIGYIIFDFFYKKDKSSGAWFNVIRDKYKDRLPIFTNVCDFQENKDGKILLNYHDVETLFHEFGHALHNILSESKYSDLSGTHVERDFVELPSQLNENWFREKESLKHIAKHNETGFQIPDKMLDILEELETFSSGNFVLRQLEFAILDMFLYSSKKFKDVKELDLEILKIVNSISIFERKDNYRMYCSFNHIFDGGYAAGYYSYIWAEIIEKDIWSEFKKNGIFDKNIAKKYHDNILAKGHIKPAKELFFDFMGREVELDAFFENIGI